VGFDTGYVDRGRQLTNYTAKLADNIGYPVSYASCATANFRLAQGSLAAYFLQTPTIMDIAAPAAIISEVGGKVSEMNGSPIDWNADSRSYLAARNEQIHSRILDIFKS
jgi:fructose-1,6-bisphosphatase/inositol monophosphatase family enzyme